MNSLEFDPSKSSWPSFDEYCAGQEGPISDEIVGRISPAFSFEQEIDESNFTPLDTYSDWTTIATDCIFCSSFSDTSKEDFVDSVFATGQSIDHTSPSADINAQKPRANPFLIRREEAEAKWSKYASEYLQKWESTHPPEPPKSQRRIDYNDPAVKLQLDAAIFEFSNSRRFDYSETTKEYFEKEYPLLNFNTFKGKFERYRNK